MKLIYGILTSIIFILPYIQLKRGTDMIYTLKNEIMTADIDSLGAELTSVRSEAGFEYIWQGEEWRGHAPLLFPLCGTLLDNKYTYHSKEYHMKRHGFTRKTEFGLVEKTDTSVTLELKASEETLSVYPFEFRLTATYRINGNKLSFNMTIDNLGKHIMPYMFGWHPAFTLGGSKEISSFYITFPDTKSLTWHPLQHECFVNPFYSSYLLKANRYYLNEEEIYKNDTMIFKDVPHTVKLAGGAQKRSVTVSFSENLPYLAIWKYPSSNARYICIEPWSDVPCDGETPENFDSRPMSRISAGESAEYDYEVVFE